METKQHLEQLLKKMEEATPVEPSHFLFAKIRHKIDEKKKGSFVFSEKLIWKTSVAFVFLIALNFAGIAIYNNINTVDQVSSTTEDEFGLMADNNYYNYSE